MSGRYVFAAGALAGAVFGVALGIWALLALAALVLVLAWMEMGGEVHQEAEEEGAPAAVACPTQLPPAERSAVSIEGFEDTTTGLHMARYL